jgi:hypothetical protein
MSNTFKYLDENKQESTDNAAQTFLNEKLSKNKYTQQQQDTLDANGGSAVETETKFNKVVSNQDAIDEFNNTPQPAGGKLSAEQIRDKFGFSYNEDHAKGSAQSKYGGADNGAIYSKSTGEYIGTIDNFTPRGEEDAEGIDQFKAVEDYGLSKGFRGQARKDWDSMNDVAGAVNDIFGQDAAKKEAPKPVYEDVPIEHSPEIDQAKERVATYENDILSGKTSEDIYANDNYSFDATKGAAGIGTPMNGDSGQQAAKATASFLDNKKSQVKDKYQFQAQS